MKSRILLIGCIFCFQVICLAAMAQDLEPWEGPAHVPAPGMIMWGTQMVHLHLYGPDKIPFYYNFTITDIDNDHGDASWSAKRTIPFGFDQFKGIYGFEFTAMPNQPGMYNVLLFGEYDPNAPGNADFLIFGMNDEPNMPNDPEVDKALILNDGQRYTGQGHVGWKITFHTTP